MLCDERTMTTKLICLIVGNDRSARYRYDIIDELDWRLERTYRGNERYDYEPNSASIDSTRFARNVACVVDAFDEMVVDARTADRYRTDDVASAAAVVVFYANVSLCSHRVDNSDGDDGKRYGRLCVDLWRALERAIEFRGSSGGGGTVKTVVVKLSDDDNDEDALGFIAARPHRVDGNKPVERVVDDIRSFCQRVARDVVVPVSLPPTIVQLVLFESSSTSRDRVVFPSTMTRHRLQRAVDSLSSPVAATTDGEDNDDDDDEFCFCYFAKLVARLLSVVRQRNVVASSSSYASSRLVIANACVDVVRRTAEALRQRGAINDSNGVVFEKLLNLIQRSFDDHVVRENVAVVMLRDADDAAGDDGRRRNDNNVFAETFQRATNAWIATRRAKFVSVTSSSSSALFDAGSIGRVAFRLRQLMETRKRVCFVADDADDKSVLPQ